MEPFSIQNKILDQFPWAPVQTVPIIPIARAALRLGLHFASANSMFFPKLAFSALMMAFGAMASLALAWDENQPTLSMQEQIDKLEKRLMDLEKPKTNFPTAKISGVFQADAVMFSQSDSNRDAFGEIENGADFRRARLAAGGAVTENMNYFFQMDFGFFGRPTFTDVWVDFKEIPLLGNVRIGQWKHPFSLEVVSSFRYTTFMERSSLFQAFTPFRHIGTGFYDHSSDLNTTWAVSYMRTGQDQFGGSLSDEGGNGMAARLTHLLWYGGFEGEQYIHLGGAYHLNAPPNSVARFRSTPEMFVGDFAPGGTGTSGQAVPGVLNGTPFFVDTLPIADVDVVNTFGIEAMLVNGPFSIQSEVMAAVVDSSVAEPVTFGGAYAQVGYFLTGEHRPYDRASGAIDRVMPRCNFKPGEGIGAWEIAGRWSYIDLTDGSIVGGTMQDMTIGLNWYVNPYCKCVFNYIHTWVEGRDYFPSPTAALVQSQADIFGLRCQLDF